MDKHVLLAALFAVAIAFHSAPPAAYAQDSAAGIPVSSTHVITGAIAGVGASRRLTAVRWGVTRQILWAWVLTIPGAGLMGAIFHFLFMNWVR